MFFKILLHLLDQFRIVRTHFGQARKQLAYRWREHGSQPVSPSPGLAASFAWHIRQMSPASTPCSISVVPASSITRTFPSAGISNVLSCDPYSSACLSHEADVGDGSHGPRIERAVLLAESDRFVVDAGIAAVGDHGLVSCSLFSLFHIWPEARIIAGMDASIMMSLGT